MFIFVLFVQRMIRILWKIFIILHGNSCIFKGLVYGEICFENRSSEVNLKYNKIKLVLILRNSGHELYSF